MCHLGHVTVHLVLKACVWVLKIRTMLTFWCVQHAVKLLEMLVGVINAYLRLCCCIGEEVLNGNLCRSRATPKVSMSSAVHVF